MYINDKIGRVSVNGAYKLTSRGYSNIGAGGAHYYQDRAYNCLLYTSSKRKRTGSGYCVAGAFKRTENRRKG